jgi:hypothetical protein
MRHLHAQHFVPTKCTKRHSGCPDGFPNRFKFFIREEGMLKKPCFFLLFAIIIATGSDYVMAQEYGTIQATATVLPSMSVIGTNDLMFETVMPGTPKIVDKATIGRAGAFEITGFNSAEISLDFDLPVALLLDSTATMPINFGNTDASYDDGTAGGQTAPVAAINPNGPLTLRLGDGGQMFLWIGGTVDPGITQTGGDYAADITLSVVYTGN